jgi:predicted O-methyltransferase YrrM
MHMRNTRSAVRASKQRAAAERPVSSDRLVRSGDLGCPSRIGEVTSPVHSDLGKPGAKVNALFRSARRAIVIRRAEKLGDLADDPEFDRILKKVTRSGTDSLAHFGDSYVREGGLSLQQNPAEFAALCTLLRKQAQMGIYLEIGSASGGACRFLYEELHFRQVVCLDDQKHPRAAEQVENFKAIATFALFAGDSHSDAAESFLAASLDGPLDVAFIDGDHSYDGVRLDLQLILRFARPGTIVIFHDIVACPGVAQMWVESITRRVLAPLAEYVAEDRPLGIGVGTVRGDAPRRSQA